MAKVQDAIVKEKYELVFENEYETMIWKYDLTKFKNGPISVEIKPKYEPIKPKKKKLSL